MNAVTTLWENAAGSLFRLDEDEVVEPVKVWVDEGGRRRPSDQQERGPKGLPLWQLRVRVRAGAFRPQGADLVIRREAVTKPTETEMIEGLA